MFPVALVDSAKRTSNEELAQRACLVQQFLRGDQAGIRLRIPRTRWNVGARLYVFGVSEARLPECAQSVEDEIANGIGIIDTMKHPAMQRVAAALFVVITAAAGGLHAQVRDAEQPLEGAL